MTSKKHSESTDDTLNASRRKFIQRGGLILAGSAIVGSHAEAISSNNAHVARCAHAFGTDTIKVGVIGCGRRGTKAAMQAISTAGRCDGRVELVAIADAFANNMHKAYRTIKGRHLDSIASNLQRFDGLSGYQGVMASDADVVILATPPVFRPQHFQAAVAAGKHVFMEKPVAIDVEGIEQIMASAAIARDRGIAVSVGLQRRHELRYQQTIQQLRSGLIGDPTLARACCLVQSGSVSPRRKNESDDEYRLRNWSAFDDLGGGRFVEQHIQNLDVINWLVGETPSQAVRHSVMTESDLPGAGPTSSHQAVEFAYPRGTKLLSQIGKAKTSVKGWRNEVGEHVQCTHGSADIGGGKIFDAAGKLIWRSEVAATKGSGWQGQQDDFFDALRRGQRPDETDVAIKSTMTALLGSLASKQAAPLRWAHVFAGQEQITGAEAT